MAEKTCDRYGVAQQGPSANRPLNAWDGFLYYDTDLREVIVWDGTIKNWFATSGGILYSASSPRILTDDFKQATMDAGYCTAVGSDSSDVVAAAITALASKPRGELAMTSGNGAWNTDHATTFAVNASAWSGPACNLEAHEGAITVEFKAKISAITECAFFLGLTDVVPSTTLENTFGLLATTFTSTATDAVGFLFDTKATVDTIRAVGVKADTDAMTDTTSKLDVTTALAPVADTYAGYKIVVDTSGNAKFYTKVAAESAWNTTAWILQKTLADAVTATVDLVPIAWVTAWSTATRTLTLDYISVK